MIILIIIWSIKTEKHSTSLKAHTKWWFVNKLLPSSPRHLKIYQDNSPLGTYTTKYQKKKSFKTKVMILNTCNQLHFFFFFHSLFSPRYNAICIVGCKCNCHCILIIPHSVFLIHNLIRVCLTLGQGHISDLAFIIINRLHQTQSQREYLTHLL